MSKRAATQITPSTRRKPECTRDGCESDAIFGFRGAKAERCGTHKKPRQVAIYVGYCRVCGVAASYGQPGGKRDHCTTHRQEGEVDLKSPHCRMCDTVASFSVEGVEGSPVEWCIRHLPRTTEIPPPVTRIGGHKFCDVDGCRTRAYFGLEGGIAHRCGSHRLEDYINLRVQRCEQCRTVANFGLVSVDGERQKTRWCRTHAPDGAICFARKKECVEDGCKKVAWYGLTKKTLRHCLTHRTEPDTASSHTQCMHCDKRALWGAPAMLNRQRTKVRCIDHRLPGDVSYRTRKVR